jgi:hypothetical protein
LIARFRDTAGLCLLTNNILVGMIGRMKSCSALLLITLGLLVFPVCTAGCTDEIKPKRVDGIPTHFVTYHDEAGFFSVSYPDDWKLESEVMEVMDALNQSIMVGHIDIDKRPEIPGFFQVKSKAQEENPALLSIHAMPLTGATSDLEQLEQKIINTNINYRVLERLDTAVNGEAAVIMRFDEASEDNPPTSTLLMLAIGRGFTWNISCVSYQENYQEYDADFQAIVRSFRILK